MSDYFGKDVFKLGFGLMRLPKDPSGRIDVSQTSEMVDLFLDAGGTYFDTAYVYEGSEEAAAQALVKRHDRGSYTLATKLNAGIAPDEKSAKEQFYTSLKRTGAEYFDYYLLHALGHGNVSKYDEYHLWDFAAEQKEKGLIRYMGFSFHADPALLDQILTAHPEVDFIQLQINYADWENPEVRSRECWEIARRHGKSITVMEPVKGGALARPVPEVQRIFDETGVKASYASWAIRYVASLDGILTVLSGMSNLEQMKDNLSYMKDFKPLDDAEQATIRRAQFALEKAESIACTGCHYCTKGCPVQIPIPEIFSARNEELVFGDTARSKELYEKAVTGAGRAGDCVHCLQCESACPQHLPVTRLLEETAAVMGS